MVATAVAVAASSVVVVTATVVDDVNIEMLAVVASNVDAKLGANRIDSTAIAARSRRLMKAMVYGDEAVHERKVDRGSRRGSGRREVEKEVR